jgi:hypothetical protein
VGRENNEVVLEEEGCGVGKGRKREEMEETEEKSGRPK